jgi:hypothetical protein
MIVVRLCVILGSALAVLAFRLANVLPVFAAMVVIIGQQVMLAIPITIMITVVPGGQRQEMTQVTDTVTETSIALEVVPVVRVPMELGLVGLVGISGNLVTLRNIVLGEPVKLLLVLRTPTGVIQL